MMTPDYAMLDAQKAWLHKTAWDADVEALGYRWITEMIHQTFLTCGSVHATARELGISHTHTGNLLRYIGARVAPKGGRNYTVLTPELVRALRIGWEEVGRKTDYAMRFRANHGLTCHPETLLMALEGRTWGCV